MREAVSPLLLAVALVGLSTAVESLLLRVGLAWCAFSFAWMSVGYAASWRGMFGKRRDGRLALWSVVLLMPLHVFNRVALWLASLRLHPFDEVAPGVLLGGRPSTATATRADAVLDLTAEFSATTTARGRRYLCVPVLDYRAPTHSELAQAVAFIVEQRAHGRTVLVHCAMGHGRSATAVVAYLCHTLRDSVDSALRRVQAARPGARPTRSQLEAAAAFCTVPSLRR